MAQRISARSQALNTRTPREGSSIGKRIAFAVIGIIVGGALQDFARVLLPPGPAKQFLTSGIAWQSPPTHPIPFLIGHLTLGPLAIDVSLTGIVVCVFVIIALRRIF